VTDNPSSNLSRPATSSTDTMRLFRSSPRERALTTMLRCMERGRFNEAWKSLRKHDDELPVPPHALSRLGRWLADRGEHKKAVLPLRTFLDTYPKHQDRATVVQGLALCLKRIGKVKEAERVEANR